MQVHACAESVPQVRGRGAQTAVGQGDDGLRVRGSFGQRLQHPAGAEPQQVGHQAGKLVMWACSSKASSRFWSWTRERVNWNFVRVRVRQRRWSGSGTKLKTNSWATKRFTSRS